MDTSEASNNAIMAINYKLLLALILCAFIISVAYSENESVDDGSNDDSGDDEGIPIDLRHFNRSSFPPEFVFGAATSAYQIEGGSKYRGKNTWDVFIEKHPEKITNRSNASIAADSYHRYKEDVCLINVMGFDAYRISIAWSRLIPTGKVNNGSGINRDGIRYYNELIDEILAKGMQPFVTIFHWDIPQKLEDEYKGFLHNNIVEDFETYANVCFTHFGNKVKYWITLNEPWSYATCGYAYGSFPPNRCSNRGIAKSVRFRAGRFANNGDDDCKYGNSGTEPYIVTHHMLLAHAAAVKLYRENYQKKHGGQIGITLVSEWFEPYDNNSQTDIDAATRSLAFMFGWYMDPLFIGAYPEEMVLYVGENRLPTFNKSEAAMVKGSYDFIGVNYYTATYSQDLPCNKSQENYLTDPCVNTTQIKDGKPIGGGTGAEWLYVYPRGFQKLLVHIKDKYNNPPLYVTENGVCRDDRGSRPRDVIRINYHRSHLKRLQYAINIKEVNVRGYFVWSLMDNFEWLDGYFINFGVIRVDYDNNTLNRSCKESASWFNSFLNKDGASNEAKICKRCLGN